MSGEVLWEEPTPSDGRGNRAHGAWQRHFAEELRSRPGVWALYADDATTSVSSNIKTGVLVAFRPAGHFQSTTRRTAENTPGHSRIYARFVGEAES